jgi:sugar O-acyltransferase (sialic acid O-acetyltransferase NeuD family)
MDLYDSSTIGLYNRADTKVLFATVIVEERAQEMADIVVFGAGQIAEVVQVYIDVHGPHRIVGFTVDGAFKRTDSFAGRPLVAWEELEAYFSPAAVELLGPLSFRRLNEFRRDRYLDGKARGYRFASFIHPSCHIYTDAIGENCLILEGNTLQPFTRIGDDVMIWSANHIGHHSVIGDHCFISSQVGISSNVTIGERCFLGGKVGIDYGFKIGPGCFLGGGAIIKRNLAADTVVQGPNDPAASYSSPRLKRLV